MNRRMMALGLAAAIALPAATAAAQTPIQTPIQPRIVVSGDTGPLHLAAAAGTPVVGLYGPTPPERNGPWDPRDVTVSAHDRCACVFKRQCTAQAWCLESIPVETVIDAVTGRLGVPA